MRWISPLLLLAGLGLLLLFWGAVPEHWPIHWGPGGVVNGWGHKSLPSALAPFGLGALIWLFLEAIAVFLHRRGQTYPILTTGYLAMIRWIGLAIVASTVFVGVALPLLQPGPGLSVKVILGAVGLCTALGFLAVIRAGRRSRAADEALPTGYSALGYYAPDDPRVLVPKIHGLGWTFNFARPLSWALMVLILLPAVIAIGAVLLAAR